MNEGQRKSNKERERKARKKVEERERRRNYWVIVGESKKQEKGARRTVEGLV